MGVFIDYAFHVQCSEQDLLDRMGRLREKLLKLPFDSVSPILSVDPAYQPLQLEVLRDHGFPIPEAVLSRLRDKLGTRHDELCLLAAPCALMLVSQELHQQFLEPAVQFSKTTSLWRHDDLPEKIEVPYSLIFYRMAFAVELASVILRHGHLIVVQPCEGCETFAIGLTRFRPAGSAETPTEGSAEPPSLWLGSGFTKTQYATRFVQAHEGICKALDFAAKEGLLLDARDTSGFYAHRDWKKSADVVNAETTFAQVVGGALRAGVQSAQDAGVKIEDLSSPATRNYNLVRVDSEDSEDSEGQQPVPPRP